jgi:hypothetical protein
MASYEIFTYRPMSLSAYVLAPKDIDTYHCVDVCVQRQRLSAGLAQSFDDGERMRPSRYYELVADVMEELVKFTLLTHCIAMSFDRNPASDVA